MVPVAGSAYTYAYATLGELVAWIIGWDLILEYAIGSSVVAAGWSNYLDAFLHNVFHIQLDPRLRSAPWDYDLGHGTFLLKTVTLADGQTVMAWLNLPAVFITAAVTVVLVIGVKESAGFNAAMVLLNIGVILTVVGIGAAYIEPRNWRPFLHEDKGWRGVAEGAGRIFFAYIGFDSISTHAEEARRPQRDLAIGIMGALTICTILYVAVAVVLTGMVPYRQIDFDAPLSAALQDHGLTFAGGLITLGILAGMTSSLLVGNLSQPRILLAMARDGLLAPGNLRGGSSSVQDALEIDDPGRRGRRRRRPRWPLWVSSPTWSASAPCLLSWSSRPRSGSSGSPIPTLAAPFAPLASLRLDHGRPGQWRHDVLLGPRKLDAAVHLARPRDW